MDATVAWVQTFAWCCIELRRVVWLVERHRRGQEIESIYDDVAVHQLQVQYEQNWVFDPPYDVVKMNGTDARLPKTLF